MAGRVDGGPAVTALPPALRPWAAQLSLFPEELALQVGPHVARLAAALGSLRPRGETEGGEPQGYDGLTRRGPYERLLVSEWLWALEAPEELVRRAAYGELSFLKPAFRQPQGARRTVVLLDTGPDQLGMPRIAQLALLVVFARRAEAAGAGFAWGSLQADPRHQTHQGLGNAALLSWLGMRSPAPVAPGHLAAWREALDLDAAPGDTWLVGSSRLGRVPGTEGMSRVEIAEPLEPGAHRLTVDLRPAGRPVRSVALELPPPDDCVRLLRNPFERSATARTRKGGRRLAGFRFSGDGRRLLLFSEDGGVEAMAVPHSPRATVPKARRVQVPADQRVVAAGWRSTGGLIVLARYQDGYVLHGQVRTPKGFRKLRCQVADDPRRPDPPSGALPLNLVSHVDPQGVERFWMRDADERLFLLAPFKDAATATLWVVEERVSALADVRGKPVGVLRPDEEGARISRLAMLADGERFMPLNARQGDAFFGYSPAPAHPEAGLLAVRDDAEAWRLFLDTGVTSINVPGYHRVVGVVKPPLPSPPGLLTIGMDQRTFYVLSGEQTQLVTVASGPVSQVAASHSQPVFGWLTTSGEFALWDLMEKTLLYRALPEATS
jgi:hypothetical protein